MLVRNSKIHAAEMFCRQSGKFRKIGGIDLHSGVRSAHAGKLESCILQTGRTAVRNRISDDQITYIFVQSVPESTII